MKKLFTGLVVAAVIAVAGGAWWLRLVTWETHAGFFGPAFSHDGKHVYAVTRETRGLTWGLGWEHFTPPAYAYAVSDRFSLVRIEVASGSSELLESWTSTPVARRIIREYRGRVFNTVHAMVRPESDGTVRYQVEMAIPVVPLSEVHRIAGVWADASGKRERGEWARQGYARGGPSEPVLSGQVEVFTLSGPEFFPSAIVLLDHRTMNTRVIAKDSAYAERYPGGPQLEELLSVSRKKDIDRVAEVRRVRDEHVARYRAQGSSDIEALLKTNRDLEDLGYLPKSPRIVATRLAATAVSTLPVFEIAEAEMASGVFPDVEKAIATPGAEIDKSMGRYIIHRDFANSERLNAHFAGGGRDFVVRFRGETYRIEVRPGGK